MWESLENNSCDICHKSKRSESSFDKENIQQLSPIKTEELSFYDNSATPLPLCSGTSPNHCPHSTTRRPLEDHDPNSHDSGYVANYNGDFRTSNSPSRHSFESGMEDDFLEEFSDIEPLEDNLPEGFNKLISGPIRNKTQERTTNNSPRDLAIRPLFRRALSLQNERVTPNTSRVRSCLFRNNIEIRAFKRPDPPLEFDSPNSKKAKFEDDDNEIAGVPVASRPILQRAISATEESIMWAVHKSATEPDLIGDFSKTFCLPLTPGRHQDLKSITPNTLAQLMKGVFNENVASFKVIDCRYPYEYEGGHINGAINVYTKEQCMELLNNFAAPHDSNADKRNILVFHCEFSSERGPNLCRFLRKQDRQLNQDSYPSLHYPEIYLLEGGYKNFFEQFAHMCVPIAYKEMLHPEHENDLKYFRSLSKTGGNTESRQRPQYRNNLKRLGL